MIERIVYFQDIKGNRFYFDIEKRCISVDGPLFLKEMLSVLLKAHKFIGRDRTVYLTCQEKERVFFEYIPRVFGRPFKVGKIEILTL